MVCYNLVIDHDYYRQRLWFIQMYLIRIKKFKLTLLFKDFSQEFLTIFIIRQSLQW